MLKEFYISISRICNKKKFLTLFFNLYNLTRRLKKITNIKQNIETNYFTFHLFYLFLIHSCCAYVSTIDENFLETILIFVVSQSLSMRLETNEQNRDLWKVSCWLLSDLKVSLIFFFLFNHKSCRCLVFAQLLHSRRTMKSVYRQHWISRCKFSKQNTWKKGISNHSEMENFIARNSICITNTLKFCFASSGWAEYLISLEYFCIKTHFVCFGKFAE